MLIVITLLSGVFFGIGLAYSEMTNPAVVLGFLDITGNWNPSLVFVMGGAIAVGFLGHLMRNKINRPWLTLKWAIPTRRDLDSPLIIGAILFGIGWGLSGYCPGPGLTALVNNPDEGIIFVISLLIGSYLFQYQTKKPINT